MAVFFVKPVKEVVPLLGEIQQRRAERGFTWCVVNSEKWYVTSMHRRTEAAQKQADQYNRRYPQPAQALIH